MIPEWLEEYRPVNQQEATLALREIMQEIALAGLWRANFFEKAAFYGGTALRIFHKLDRFSEDLDFSLLKPDPDFSMQPYLDSIVLEFKGMGMDVKVQEKKKLVKNNINSAFLKSETIWKQLVLEGVLPQTGLEQLPKIKIKIEVDVRPPSGFETEELLLLKPFSFYVKCFTLPNLFAGKMHALLFRKWGTNVKGRDWYDMEWYIRKGVPLSLSHFLIRAQDSGEWPKDKTISKEEFMKLLNDKIDSVNMEYVLIDAVRFIKDRDKLKIWSPEYFHALVAKIKIEE